MAILSNHYFFPFLQLALLALLLFAVWHDYRPLTPSGISATVTRASESMSILEKVTGLVIAAIVTIINKSVFDDGDSGWQHYSAIINALDLGAIVYLCYVSSWGRNHIIGLNARLKQEHR
jgi:hypothetical protein